VKATKTARLNNQPPLMVIEVYSLQGLEKSWEPDALIAIDAL